MIKIEWIAILLIVATVGRNNGIIIQPACLQDPLQSVVCTSMLYKINFA